MWFDESLETDKDRAYYDECTIHGIGEFGALTGCRACRVRTRLQSPEVMAPQTTFTKVKCTSCQEPLTHYMSTYLEGNFCLKCFAEIEDPDRFKRQHEMFMEIAAAPGLLTIEERYKAMKSQIAYMQDRDVLHPTANEGYHAVNSSIRRIIREIKSDGKKFINKLQTPSPSFERRFKIL